MTMTTECVSSMYFLSPWMAVLAYMSWTLGSNAWSVRKSSGFRGFELSCNLKEMSVGECRYSLTFDLELELGLLDVKDARSEEVLFLLLETGCFPLAWFAPPPCAPPPSPLLDLLPIIYVINISSARWGGPPPGFVPRRRVVRDARHGRHPAGTRRDPTLTQPSDVAVPAHLCRLTWTLRQCRNFME